MMLCGVPNLAITIGYTNASWTLKCDLVAQYVCRLLRHMDEHGYAIATPQAPDPSQPTEPFIDLKSGYVLRALDRMPRQGRTKPWRLNQNYLLDVALLRRGRVDDAMVFARAGEREPEPAAPSPPPEPRAHLTAVRAPMRMSTWSPRRSAPSSRAPSQPRTRRGCATCSTRRSSFAG